MKTKRRVRRQAKDVDDATQNPADTSLTRLDFPVRTLLMVMALCGWFGIHEPAHAARYGFEYGEENWTPLNWGAPKDKCTNVVQSSFWGYGGSSNSLRMDCVLSNDGDTAVCGVMFDAQNLTGSQITMRVYCPAGSSGTNSQPWAWTQLRLWVKDQHYNYQETAWDAFRIPPGTSTQYVYYTVTAAGGFDSTNVTELGLQVYWRGFGQYRGPLYIDEAGFGAPYVPEETEVYTNDLRYGFEPNREGWLPETYVDPVNPGESLTGIVATAQSTNYALQGSHALRMDVNIHQEGTNRQKGGVSVDMRWYPPPPTVRAPYDLSGTTIYAYVYGPAGSGGPGPGNPNYLKLMVKSTVDDVNWRSLISAPVAIQEGQWVELKLPVGTNAPPGGYMEAGFTPTSIVAVGVLVDMSGTYTGALYLDNVCFGLKASDWPVYITNSQHSYGFEVPEQAEWWQWGTNPEGWHAKAWTNTYWATNEGCQGSIALAANAVFRTNDSAEIVTNEFGQVITNAFTYQKGVFEIAYQPALHLATKDHRKIQARLRFDPPVEGLLSFDASINVYDKITDQWYTKNFKVGGSDWNVITFDLDDPEDYEGGGPPVPMHTESIGFITVQIFGNVNWTGTICLDEIMVGGRETGTAYNKINSGFARAEGHKFVIDGTNFYHCGANIEYLFSITYDQVVELLDLAASSHVHVVRTWAFHEGKPWSFQPQRGVWNTLAFEHLDRIVAEAGHRGIRLMLGLLDNWAHNGGVFQYMKWIEQEHPETVTPGLDPEGVEFHDQYWTNVYGKQWYREYVTRLLNRTNSITGRRYKDDPTIFAWEIVNEPRAETDFSGRTIHNWLHEMSDWVRTVDTNHLLSGGEEGGYVNTYEFADTIPWEVYPDNYYHYAVFGAGSPTCDLYGCGRGHGVDFISDNASTSTYVQWQGGFYTNPGPVYGEWRTGNSNLHFATCRIYVDQKEYNVWRENQNGADQRLEWINDHWYGAHRVIGKPLILEEFGIHAIGWVYGGFYGQLQNSRTPPYSIDDRVGIYDLFYRHIEHIGMGGSYFWNLGYQGMWEDPWDPCERLGSWTWDPASAATGIAVSADFTLPGSSNALRLSYNAAAKNYAVYQCPTNEAWVLKVKWVGTNKIPVGINRVKYAWNFYNPGAPIGVALGLRGLTNNYLCTTPPQTVTTGWNRITYDLSAGTWACGEFGGGHRWNLLQITNFATGQGLLEDVREVRLVLTNLPPGAGALYMDNVTIRRDDGFVIYADDPVIPTIRAHADRMAAKNTATNRPGNHAPVVTPRLIFADDKKLTPVDIAAYDADGDPLSYRILDRPQRGWVFGSPPSNLVYRPKLGETGPDTFTYVAHDGAVDSAVGTVTVLRANFDHVRYDFERDTQGWYANYTPWSGYAVTSVAQTTAMALHGTGALRADINLYGTPPHNAGDAEVNMEYNPPPFLRGPLDLENQTLTLYVYCPAGARGSAQNPNRLQIFAKDTNWLGEYTMETDVIEREWVTFTLLISTNTPPGGWKADGFNPRAIRAVGVRIKFGGAGSEYQGPIYIDAVCFPVVSDIIYAFDRNDQGWETEDWGFGHATITWSNDLGNPRPGGLWITPTCQPTYSKYYVKDGEQIEDQNIFYKPIVRAYVWVPGGCSDNIHHVPRVTLHLRSRRDGWTYGNHSDLIALTPGQWNLVEWDASGVNPDVLRHVDEWGVEIEWPDQYHCRTPIFLDSIHVAAKNPGLAPAITFVTAASNTVGKYEKFELDVGLANVEGLNPYNPRLVDLRAAFTSPSGRVWNVNGFYMEDADDAYGRGSWRVRFAPSELGTWSYRVMVGNELGGATSAVATFTCAASGRHGWIRVSDDDPHYLEHHDDTPFVGLGYCHCWDADDEGIFSECAKNGINVIHWWMAAWDTLLTVKPADPSETWREGSSFDTYEQGRAAELDRILGYAEKHGVKLVFTIWPHDAIRDFNYHKWRLNGSWARAFDEKFSEPEWYINAFSELDNPPMNQKFFYDPRYKEYQDRLYRYIIARWGYSEAIGTWALASEMFGTFANSANCINYQDPRWVTNKTALFGENPYLNMDTNQCDGNDYTIPWLSYINGYFKTNDPFGHPTTASYATDEYWTDGFPIVDIAQIHTYADLYSWITPPVTVSKYHHHLREQYDKPSFMGEIGTVEWKLFEPDYVRVTAWPGLCSGGAITPLMWTTPAFSWFGDAKMGPWLDVMSDEMKVLARFAADIPFHRAALEPAAATTRLPGEPASTLVESFEAGMNAWHTWGDGIAGWAITTNHATHGSKALRLDINMDTYAHMPNPASGIDKYEGDGFAYNWSAYWPRGHVKMDLYIPEFYHPEHNTNGFLLGINKDPRSILEVFTRDESGHWHWYSTTNEYGGPGRESGGWKKLTVGMLWNLELPLNLIPSAYEASHIVGFKFWFGDVGILRGPIYLDNLTAGLYPFNTCAMVNTNRTFAFGWIQDRRWDDGVVESNAVFDLADMSAGTYHLEWWDTRRGIKASYNLDVPAKGTLSAPVPAFTKDTAVKIGRIGNVGATVHNVAIGGIEDFKWLLPSPYQKIEVQVLNRGSAAETFNVTLADLTDGAVIGTQTVVLAAGALTNATFTWCSTGATRDVVHTLQAAAAAVAGETNLSDNTTSAAIMLYSDVPPWDSCDRLRRWAPDSNDSDGRRLTVSTNYWTERGTSFEFYHRSPSKYQAYFGFDNVYEDWSDRTAFMMDLYNADGSTHCQLLMRTGSNWMWHYSTPRALAAGWNTNVLFDFTRADWTRVVWNESTGSNEYFEDVTVTGLEEVQQIFIKVTGYPDEGVVYVDNLRVPGFYTVHLAYTNGVDSFPRAVAEQSNYTGAAACWMIARYLNGPTFTQTQQQIYNATTHDPAHNNEITPASCAGWMAANIVPGYYFDDRYQTSAVLAVREAVYWMDYIPPGGLKTPVYLISGTNWSYKVMRGFQSDRKPYGGGGWGPWLDTNAYTVFGVWLNDPAINGLGYDIYAAATEITNVYLPSYANGQYWIVAEPPEDPAAREAALQQIESATVRLAAPEPNAEIAAFLADRFGKPGDGLKADRREFGEAGEEGDPDLRVILPWALRYDAGFMAAFEAGRVVSWYEVNNGRPDEYFLAAGGEQGPASTRYVIKVAPDGAFRQAAWVGAPVFYQPLPQATAEWAARRQFGEGAVVTTESAELVSQAGVSPFRPWWELLLNVNGTSVFTVVRQDVDLSGDADGDGMSDGDELYAGFDPEDGLSVFSVEGGALFVTGTNHVTITWESQSNRTYSVLRATSLPARFTRIASGLRATPPENAYEDRVTTPAAYYRIEVE